MIAKSSCGVLSRIVTFWRSLFLLFIWICAFAFSAAAQEPAPGHPSQPPNQMQPAPPENERPIVTPAMPEQVVQNPVAPCVQPTPPVSWRDYEGPYAKTVGFFAQRLERSSTGPHAAHYKPGAFLCTLQTRDKFELFLLNSVDPLTFLNAAYDASIGQMQNSQPSYGQGATGYAKRFGASMAGQSSSFFFKQFLYPTIFKEDPRYYWLGYGSNRRRFFHAVSHVVLSHKENGGRMFNFSEWLGTASAVVFSNTYMPDNERGFVPNAQRVGIGIATDAGYDVLREFWPEVAKTLHLPFREQTVAPGVPDPAPHSVP